LIEQWEESEARKDKEVQEYRLNNIRLRNQLNKNDKILKKKEELAEGLHLIDFEQLKIENQTLNEKIEERNEELHKLMKKIVTTVEILTHTKEKLQHVEKMNVDLKNKKALKDEVCNKYRTQLTDIKKRKDDLRKHNATLRQETGIVNSKNLKQDFDSMQIRIVELQEMFGQMKEKHTALVKFINDANIALSKHVVSNIQNNV